MSANSADNVRAGIMLAITVVLAILVVGVLAQTFGIWSKPTRTIIVTCERVQNHTMTCSSQPITVAGR